MSQMVEVRVPDIGDFAEVEVIEVLVKAGDLVAREQSLITVESDKASMEIPSSHAGRVEQMRVALGDKVSKGSLILTRAVEAAADGAARTAEAPASHRPAVAGAGPAAASGTKAGTLDGLDLNCDLLVLGGGPGGYSAAFRAADLGLDTILVERYPTLGGVCLNVGCIPSKALLHTAAAIDEVKALAGHGVRFGTPEIDLAQLRDWKGKVVGKLTSGLSTMARTRKVRIVRGFGRFAGPRELAVEATAGPGQERTGERLRIGFAQAIVAAGSEAVRLPFLPDDPRIVDSTGALALASIPERMLVIGGGIIGLEMGTVYAALGARVDVVEMLDDLMPGADRDLVRVWLRMNEKRFGAIMVGTKTVRAESAPDGVRVWFEGPKAPGEAQRYDLVLCAVGRRPNGATIDAERAGLAVDSRGFIAVDRQMRTQVPNLFAIGDIVGQPMLAHKAVHEGHVAAEAAAGHKAYFDARVIPSVAYVDPEIAWVGMTETAAKQSGIEIAKAVFPWSASGRAIANGRDEGFTKLIFDAASHRVIGGGIVGTHAGDMIGEVALAIEMGADATDVGRTIHPHPTLGESIGLAAEVFEGVCTDLAPPRRR